MQDQHAVDSNDVLGPFALRFTPTPPAIRVARRTLSSWLERQPGVDTDGIDDLLIVCSELCSNAALHSTGRPLSVALTARVDGDAVVLEVEDDGAGFAWAGPGKGMGEVDSAAESGRGLYIVAALTDEMMIESGDGENYVRVRRNGVIRHGGDGAADAISANFRADTGEHPSVPAENRVTGDAAPPRSPGDVPVPSARRDLRSRQQARRYH